MGRVVDKSIFAGLLYLGLSAGVAKPPKMSYAVVLDQLPLRAP